MSHNFEKLSALIDDELSSTEYSDAKDLLKSAEDKAFYFRQQLIKDVLHGEQVAPVGQNFAADISAKIADEPAIFAPANIKTKRSETKQKFIGLALAASVAMVSFVIIQDAKQTSVPSFSQQQVARVISDDAINNAASAKQNSLSNSGYQLASDRQTIKPHQWNGLNKQQYDNYKMMINQYLSTHTEVSTVGNIQGIMPYSKIVGYDTK